ncbi:hypothetical protein KUTeg_016367 [Tegillarca granosa]|uniref:Uncharacterized protein n=1 Tax=Tegillarca granosa TaxID=220873 RepID=A0ABQ9EPF7_TEGGR|nr:hypothetical protein KUTeg_016367 [Tegillarca granosa]
MFKQSYDIQFFLTFLELQKAFDKDKSAGNLNQDGWNSNCSHDGILAYKLIIQTGDIDNPIDRQRSSDFVDLEFSFFSFYFQIKLFTYVHQNRLVDSNGLVSQDAFYNYLTAWVTNDALVYAASMADLHPKPKDWIHDPFDRDFNNVYIVKKKKLQIKKFRLGKCISAPLRIWQIIFRICKIADNISKKNIW